MTSLPLSRHSKLQLVPAPGIKHSLVAVVDDWERTPGFHVVAAVARKVANRFKLVGAFLGEGSKVQPEH